MNTLSVMHYNQESIMHKFFMLSFCTLFVFVLSLVGTPNVWFLVVKLLAVVLVPALVAWMDTRFGG